MEYKADDVEITSIFSIHFIQPLSKEMHLYLVFRLEEVFYCRAIKPFCSVRNNCSISYT